MHSSFPMCICKGSTGKADLTLPRARDSEYTPVITVIGKENYRSVVMTTDRNIRLGIIQPACQQKLIHTIHCTGVRGRCSVHLINDGITRASSGNGSVITTIEWGLSAPSDAVTSQIGFLCSMDGRPVTSCKTIMTILW